MALNLSSASTITLRFDRKINDCSSDGGSVWTKHWILIHLNANLSNVQTWKWIWLNQLEYCIRSHGTTCWMCLIVVLFLIFFFAVVVVTVALSMFKPIDWKFRLLFFSKHANEHCYIVATAIVDVFAAVVVITTRDHFECFKFAWSYSWT